MFALRLIAILVLVLAVMPWGAFYGVQASPYLTQRDPGKVIADPSVARATVSTDGQRGVAALSPKPKRCRTAILVGSPCGPDIVLPRSVISLQLIQCVQCDGTRRRGLAYRNDTAGVPRSAQVLLIVATA